MIELSSVAYAYPRRPPIFEDFTWRIERGQTWAVLGPSGCGKTTLLYLLAGLRLPVGAGSRGQVRVYGQPLTRPRPQTGLILQDYGLLPWATVRQNAALGISIRRFYGPDGTHAPTLGAAPDAAAAPTLPGCRRRLALSPGPGRRSRSLSFSAFGRSAPADGHRPHPGAPARFAADG